MKTVLLHSYQKEHYYHELAIKNNGSVFGIRTASLSQYLHAEEEEEPVLLLQAMRLLKKDKDILIYKKMLSYPSFIREIVRFSSQLTQYGIQTNALPERNRSEKELKHILTLVSSLSLPGKNAYMRKDEVIQNLSNDPDVSILESFETDFFQFQLIEELKRRNVLVEALKKGKPKSSLYYALNTRQEIESIAQKICQEEKTVNVILTSWGSQYPVLEQVFARYGIPFSSIRKNTYLHLPLIYQALVQFASNPSRETLLKALHVNAFGKACSDHLLAWFSETMTGTDVPKGISSAFQDSPLADEAASMQAMETSAEEYFSSIQGEKNLLLSSADPKQILINAYTVMQKSPYLVQKEELSAGMEIRNVLSSSLPLIETKEDILFLAECLSTITSAGTIDNEAPIHVTDLTHPLDAAEVSYVIGCTGASYPDFPSEKGLFDENYTEQIQGWPSMQERHDAYMHQLNWIKESSLDVLNYSYPTNDYQGREIQPAYEIESQFEKGAARKYPLLTKEPFQSGSHQLVKESAHKIFAPDGKIRGSISTIERWFQCPYAYFIQSGLKVREKQISDLDAVFIGKAQHTVMEKAVRLYGKQYPVISQEKAEEYLYPYFAAICHAHPLKETEISITEERLLHSLSVSMQFLDDMEKNTPFSPKETEKQFSFDILSDVSIHGIIDRLDETDHLLRILDYKSSERRLTEKDVKAGLSLQLLTYVIIAANLWGRQPSGSYYFSLKEKAFDVPASKITGRGKKKEIVEADFSNETLKKQFINLRRISGWTFDEKHLTELDESGTHYSTRTIYDYSKSEQCLHEIYQYFHDHLLKGEIAVDPVENACDFCSYKSICRFHGQTRKAEELVMTDTSLKKDNKEEDA